MPNPGLLVHPEGLILRLGWWPQQFILVGRFNVRMERPTFIACMEFVLYTGKLWALPFSHVRNYQEQEKSNTVEARVKAES